MQVKLLAEPWDCGGLYQVGSFPNWDVWGEWNGRFRDDVRRFIKGEPGCKPAFATRLAGSADLYHKNKRRVPLSCDPLDPRRRPNTKLAYCLHECISIGTQQHDYSADKRGSRHSVLRGWGSPSCTWLCCN